MNDLTIETNRAVGRPPQGGPPLSLLAAISLVLLLAGLVIGVALAGVMPLPYGSATAIQDYVGGHHAAAVAIAVGTFGSSIPLAIYAATASARLRQLGITAPGATIALAGGLLPSAGPPFARLPALTPSPPEGTSRAPVARPLHHPTYPTRG